MISKEQLRQEIINSSSLVEIRKKLGIGELTLNTYIKKYNFRNMNFDVFKLLDEGLSIKEIREQVVCLSIDLSIKISKEITKEWLTDLYIKLLTKTAVYNFLGISKKQLDIILKKLELELDDRLITSKVYELYANTNNIQLTAEKIGCSTTKIRNILEKNNLLDKTSFSIARETLVDLYINKKYTDQEIATLYNVSVGKITYQRTVHNITRELIQLDKDEIHNLYQEHNTYGVAAIKNCSPSYIQKYIAANNISKLNKYPNKETVLEVTIRSILDSIGVFYEQNNRSILKPKELDFYIPSKKIAIEANGNYWHSTAANLDIFHIYNKYKLCDENNIRLITIFEDEICNNVDIVKNRIISILKGNKIVFGARNTNIQVISSSIGRAFLKKTHIQGAGTNSVYLGAFYEQQLVAVMSFSHPSVAKGKAKAEWELNRFASISNIPGVASKLFKFFERAYKPKSVISYADLRWNTGNLYTRLGFVYTHSSKPNYWYTTGKKDRVHRYSYTKHKLLELYPQEDIKQTEREIAEKHGLYRLYDCGNAVYLWKSVI